jgi:endonuclease/exonuclease/phosphatase (EEP) superfamily protein YafD
MIRKIAGVSADVYIAATAAWALAWKLGRDRWGALGLANAWAFWLVVAALPVGVLRLGRRSRWLAAGWLAGGLALLAGRYTVARPLAAHFPEDPASNPGDTGLRLLSFNLLKDNTNSQAAIDLIRREAPDVVALQELTPEMAAALNEGLAAEYPHRYHTSQPGRRSGPGFYARIPFQVTRVMTSGRARPFAIRATFDLPAGPLDVYDVHLLPTAGKTLRLMGPTANFRLRAEQARQIVDEIRLRGRPALALGDYNMTEGSEVYRILKSGLADAWRLAGRGLGWTWPRSLVPYWDVPSLAMLRIDYCFCTEDVRPWQMRVVRDRLGSDHCPLVVDLHIAPPAGDRLSVSSWPVGRTRVGV